ncbi:unannotated protein [freshwater metagenome]|uniref:Unannotated protein n=1 Tax=freshwater metagenome TaxID=449393 RepID=A0A6J7D655_9ZZZZ|nr:PH domain-containing protein [Actinomycetota bacterium]
MASLDLAPGEQVIFDGHPSWRSVISLYVKGAGIGLIVGVILWFAVSHTTGVIVFLAIIGIAVLTGFIRRMFVRFTITDQRLRIQRGVISRRVQQTRIDRVQNVTTRQSIADRLLQVGAVDFDTAGADDANFVFDGVDKPQQVVAAVDEAQRLAGQAAGQTGATAGGL